MSKLNRRDCVPHRSGKVPKQRKRKQFPMKEVGFSREKTLVSPLSRILWTLSAAIGRKCRCRGIAVSVRRCKAVRSRTVEDACPYKDSENRTKLQYRFGKTEAFALQSTLPYRASNLVPPSQVGSFHRSFSQSPRRQTQSMRQGEETI